MKRIAALVIAFTAILGTGGSAYATATTDPMLTPGATNPAVTEATIHQTICTRGYTATVRNVSTRTKSVVYAEYHVAQSDKRRYVIDHLVPLEVGGSNDVKNLWPEPKADAEQKDQIENLLHARVCNGTVDLATAQQTFETEWSPGGTATAPTQPPAPAPTTATATPQPTDQSQSPGNGATAICRDGTTATRRIIPGRAHTTAASRSSTSSERTFGVGDVARRDIEPSTPALRTSTRRC